MLDAYDSDLVRLLQPIVFSCKINRFKYEFHRCFSTKSRTCRVGDAGTASDARGASASRVGKRDLPLPAIFRVEILSASQKSRVMIEASIDLLI